MQRSVNRGLKIYILAALGFLCSAAYCAEPKLNGMSLYSELGSEQFIAALYAETATKDFKKMLLTKEDKRIELKVVANSIFSRRFKRMWIEGVAINSSSAELQKHAPNLATFSNLLKIRLKKNDLLTITRSTRKGVALSLNGVELGTIADPTFFDLILRTWIGAVPLSSEFRKSLLTGGTIDSDLLARYYSLTASASRVAKIKSSLQISAETIAAAATEITPGLPQAETTEQAPTPKEANQPDTLAGTTPNAGTVLNTNATPNADTVPNTNATSNTDVISDVVDEQRPNEVADNNTLNENADNTNTLAVSNTSNTPQPELTIEDDIFEEDDDDTPITAGSLLAEQLYISKVTRWTQKHIKYPRLSIKRNQEGTVRLTLEVSKSGEVVSVEILAASDHKSLNKAAVSAIKQASPFPAIPPDLNRKSYKITIPVIFQLR